MEFRYAFTTSALRFRGLDVTMRSAMPLRQRGDARQVPLGGMVWASAIALGAVLNEEKLDGKRVLELGCGAGLCSVVAAKKRAVTTGSDSHPDMRELLEHNARINGVKVAYAAYDWSSEQTPGRFDVVIASDVLYRREQVELVMRALERTIGPGGVAILSDPGRGNLDALAALAKMRGFRCERSKRMIDDVTHPTGIKALRFHPTSNGPFDVVKLTSSPPPR